METTTAPEEVARRIQAAERCRANGNTAYSDQRWATAAEQYASGIAALEGADASSSVVHARPLTFPLWATLRVNAAAVRAHQDDPDAVLRNVSAVVTAAPTARASIEAFRSAAKERRAAGEVLSSEDATLLEQPALLPPKLLAKLCFREGQALALLSKRTDAEAARLEDPEESPDRGATFEDRRALRRRSDDLAVRAAEALRRAVMVHEVLGSLPGGPSQAEVTSTVAGLTEFHAATLFRSASTAHPLVDKAPSTAHGIGLMVAPPPTLAALRQDPVVGPFVLPATATAVAHFDPDADAAVAIRAGTTILAEMPATIVESLKPASEPQGRAATVLDWEQRMHEAMAHLLTLRDATDPELRETYGRVLALHATGAEAGLSAKEAEPVAVCDVWHANAMKLAEFDFRIAGNDYRNRMLDEFDDPALDVVKPGPDGKGVVPHREDPDRSDHRPAVSVTEGIGAAVYLDASRVNHSCRPNCVQVFDFSLSEVRLVALRDIRRGEELTIAYCPPVASAEAKAAALRFRCRCEVCRGPIQELLEQLTCPGCGASAAPATLVASSADGKAGPPQCAACGGRLPLPQLEAAVLDRIEQAQGMVAANRRSDALRSLLAVERGVGLLGPRHHLRFRIHIEALAAGVWAVGRREDALEAQRVCRHATETVAMVCPPNWPLHTGLLVHGAYLAGVLARLEFRELQEQGSLAGSREVESGAIFTLRWFAKALPEAFDACRTAVAEAFGHHDTAMDEHNVRSFWLRYRPELECIGIETPVDFKDLLVTPGE